MVKNDTQKSENIYEYYLENDTEITKKIQILNQRSYYFDFENLEILFISRYVQKIKIYW
jgi:antirestriction protein